MSSLTRRGTYLIGESAAPPERLDDRGKLEESQRIQYPCVAGYVAFYQGDYERAIAELSKADLGIRGVRRPRVKRHRSPDSFYDNELLLRPVLA